MRPRFNLFVASLLLTLFALPTPTHADSSANTETDTDQSAEPVRRTTDRVATAGHLVIVGGGLKPDNEPIYRAVLDRIGDDGTLGVLPTASGVPEESGPGHVEDFQKYAGPNQKVVLIDIRNGEVDKARDPAWVQQIAECDGLWFTGGDQSRIVDTFRPTHPETGDNDDTPAYEAMWDLLDRGGVIGGTSAGAAMMSDPMIKWGNSHEALLLGVVNDVEDMGVGVGKGMGFFGDSIVDQHFFRRGRLGRLIAACKATGSSGGFGVGENTALVIGGGENKTMQVIGEPGVLVVMVAPDARRTRLDPVPEHLIAVVRFPAGFESSGWRPGSEPVESTEAPSLAQVQQWMSGAPQSYDDRFPFSISDDVGRQPEGLTVFGIYETEESIAARTVSQSELGDKRKPSP